MRLRPAVRPTALRRAARAVGGQLSGERMALVRCAAGSVLLARPTTLAQALGARPALVGSADWVVRMFGARELALGLGVLAASQAGDPGRSRAWLLAGALSDAVDVVAMSHAVRSGDLGRTGWTRAAAATCAAGAVVAVGAQVAAARR